MAVSGSASSSAIVVCILLHLHMSVLALPLLTDSNTDGNTGMPLALLSGLHQRVRRSAQQPLPPPEDAMTPETAAHYAELGARSYGAILPVPKLLTLPSYYYYLPRVYVSVPEDYYNSYYPKSDLFRLGASNYINDLLPIFKKETPTAKVDPVPSSQLPNQGRSGGNSNFPFWNQQASSWVWPDGISTGSLPSALFGLQSKEQNSVQLAALPGSTGRANSLPAV